MQKILQTKIVEKIKTHILRSVTLSLSLSFLSKIVPFVRYLKNIVELGRPKITIKHSACALHVAHLRLQIYTLIMQYLFSTVRTNAPQCYIVCALSVLFRVYLYCDIRYGPQPGRPVEVTVL